MPTITRERSGHALLAGAAIVLIAFNLRTALASVPPILPDLGLSRAGEAALATLPLLLFSGAALAGPALRRWLGQEQGLFAATAALLAGMAIRAAWPSGPALMAGTVLACAGIAAMNVLLPGVIGRRFPGRAGLMTGLYTMSLSIGAALAAGLTVPMRDAADSNGVALAVWALPVLLALAVWAPIMERRDSAPAAVAPVSLWRNPLAWKVTVFMGVQSATFYMPFSWLPTIYRDNGFDPATAGLLLSVFTAAGICSNLAAPVIASRMADQRAVVGGGAMLTMIGLLGMLIVPDVVPAVWAFLLGLGQGASLSVALLMIVLRGGDPATAARLSTMAQGVGYLICAAAVPVVPILHGATDGWTVPLLSILALACIQLASGLGAGRAKTVDSAGAVY